jgi:hypothetical protein
MGYTIIYRYSDSVTVCMGFASAYPNCVHEFATEIKKNYRLNVSMQAA